MYETFINEYYMYKNEPMHLIRFNHNGIIYLIGQEFQESVGVKESRKKRNYSKPTQKIIKEHFGTQ